MGNHAIEDWLNEADIPADFGGPDAGAPPTGPEIGAPQGDASAQMPPDGPAEPTDAAPPEDLSQDPSQPEMPEEDPNQGMDFEQWKNQFMRESIKGNSTLLIDMINRVRDRDLDPPARKFVEDNLQIQFLRQHSNIIQASRSIANMIKEQLDKNNPSTSLVQFMQQALMSQPLLTNIFIKLNGYLGMKGDLHRKYMSSLLGAVQVGSGSATEDIIIADNEFWVLISTRMNSKFGDVNLGNWNLKSDDPERFLQPPETEKLTSGSPEEREALRHRVVIESIANRFKQRSFIVTVVGNDGTIYNVGIDMGTMLRAAFVDGRLIVKTRLADNMEVMLDESGELVPVMEVEIRYRKDTGEVDAGGKPTSRDDDFMIRRDDMIFLTANLETLKDAMSNMQGITVQEIPYQGNPSDLQVLSRCTYNASDLLMKQC